MNTYILQCTGGVSAPVGLQMSFEIASDEMAIDFAARSIPKICNRHIYTFYLWRNEETCVMKFETEENFEVRRYPQSKAA